MVSKTTLVSEAQSQSYLPLDSFASEYVSILWPFLPFVWEFNLFANTLIPFSLSSASKSATESLQYPVKSDNTFLD